MEYSGISSLCKLKSLNLDLSSRDNKIDSKTIADGLSFSDRSSLRDLSLILDSATDSHLTAIASHCPNLIQLSVQDKNYCDSTSLTLSGIKLLLEKCKQLHIISLTIKGLEKFKDITEDGIENLNITLENDTIILKKIY